MTTRSAAPPAGVLRFLWCYVVVFAPLVPSSLGAFGSSKGWYERLWSGPVEAIVRVAGGDVSRLSVGSGAFQLGLVVCFLVAAGIASMVWRLVRPSAPDPARLAAWLRTATRYVLAAGTIHYAVVTLLRFELARLTPEMLLTPPGEMRANELLWIFLGWSPLFTTFLGGVELAGGILLLSRRTATLGALTVGGVLSNVVLLNIVFEIPEKLLSPHFVVLILIVLAPDARRMLLAHFSSDYVPAADLGIGAGPRRVGRGVKTAVVIAMFASPLLLVRSSRGALWSPARDELAGLYRVVRPTPAEAGPNDWAHAVIGADGATLHVQLEDRTWLQYDMAVEGSDRLLLSKAVASEWRAARTAAPAETADALTIQRPKPDRLELAGTIEGHAVRLTLEAIDVEREFNIFTGSGLRRRLQTSPSRPGPARVFPPLKRPPA